MQVLNGPINKVLEVDLTSRTFGVVQISPENRRMYLGGKGLGLKLLFDRMKPGVDPLGSENMIALMSGVLSGTEAPCSAIFEAVTKSPLTGLMADSSCGGHFGIQLKTAGWDGLIIKGASEEPVSIEITAKGVEFIDAASLWRLDTISAGKILAGENRESLVIGPAGENKVRFANIASGDKFFGRAGMGAVMGSKKLKAVVAVGGTYKIRPFNSSLFKKINDRAVKYIKRNKISKAYNEFGTCCKVDPVNRAKILPVNNFTEGSHDYAFRLSGENLKKKHDTQSHSCDDCRVECGHKGTFNGESFSVPEYETVAMLGANFGIFDSEKIASWNKICALSGMDTISAGGTLAWVMEASAKGLVDEVDLKFGRSEGVAEALESISECFGFGADMAMGTRALAEKYGGRDFAIQVKGLEMPAYDPRGSFGQGLAYAVANRGASLSAFLVGFEVFTGLLKNDSVKAKPEFVKFMEDLTCCVNSIQTCQLCIYPYILESFFSKYTPDFILRRLMQNTPKIAIPFIHSTLFKNLWSAATGEEISKREFLRAGERIHILERYMNVREGVSRKDDTLPKRMLKEWRENDPEKLSVPLDDMLDAYYKLRGYDENGIPTDRKLKKLGIISELSLANDSVGSKEGAEADKSQGQSD